MKVVTSLKSLKKRDIFCCTQHLNKYYKRPQQAIGNNSQNAEKRAGH